MALPLGLALIGGAAQTALRVGGRRALASGAKYFKQGADAVSSKVGEVASTARNYFSKPKQIGYNKPDFVVDSKGTARLGANKTYPVVPYEANKQAAKAAAKHMPKAVGAASTVMAAESMVSKDEKPSGSVDTGKQVVRAGRGQFTKGGDAPKVAEVKADTPEPSTPKKQEGVAKVQTGNGGNSSKYSLSKGTTSVGIKPPSESDGDEYSGEGLKVTGAAVKAFGDNIRVGGSGNMDAPDPDPQFEAAMADYEEFKSAGGDGSDLEGFRSFQNKKYAKKATK
jgi:hypothetical protein